MDNLLPRFPLRTFAVDQVNDAHIWSGLRPLLQCEAKVFQALVEIGKV
jgi:hypothetical protein